MNKGDRIIMTRGAGCAVKNNSQPGDIVIGTAVDQNTIRVPSSVYETWADNHEGMFLGDQYEEPHGGLYLRTDDPGIYKTGLT